MQELSKELSEKDSIFWKTVLHKNIYTLLTEGKSEDEIIQTLHITKPRLTGIWKNPSFLRRLQDFLFLKEIRKVLLLSFHIEKMSKDIEKRSTQGTGELLPKVPDSVFLKEFDRLLLDSGVKKANPELFALVLRFASLEKSTGMTEEEQDIELKKKFGYEEAKFSIPENEGNNQPVNNQPVDRGEPTENQQGPAD